jgi:hypothetical protein
MQITKNQAQLIIDELEPLLQAAMAKHGLDKPKLKWNYGDYFGLKLEASSVELGDNGVNLASAEAQYFTRFGYRGVTAPLGTMFENKGTKYSFIGIASKRSKYPIAAVNQSTNTTTFFPEGIIPLLNKAATSVAV